MRETFYNCSITSVRMDVQSLRSSVCGVCARGVYVHSLLVSAFNVRWAISRRISLTTMAGPRRGRVCAFGALSLRTTTRQLVFVIDLTHRRNYRAASLHCTVLHAKAIPWFSLTTKTPTDQSMQPATKFRRMAMPRIRLDSKVRRALRYHAMQARRFKMRSSTSQTAFFESNN